MQKENKYPKVLIIECYFNNHSGAGITLSNLFKGWPEDKLFVASSRIYPEGTDICKKYYRFGHEEKKRPWPFNKFQPYYKSEEVIFTGENKKTKTGNAYMPKASRYNRHFKVVLNKVLHFFGLYYMFFPLNVSNKFMEWVKEINPDLIYIQLSDVDTIFFMDSLIQKIKLPYVVHIMDDWPKTINHNGLENLIWKRRVKKVYLKLFSGASQLLSICQGMSNEYKLRYNMDFIPFQNCIEPDFWVKFKKGNWAYSGTFKILYAGRIGIGTSHSVLQIAKAVEKLGMDGEDIEFQVQSKSIKPEILKQLNQLKHTKVNDFLAYEELPEKFASVDLLVLPMDFNRKNLNYIRFSMPTKVPEYFASGTPILVFADKTTALVEYAQSGNWGEVVTENSIDALSKTIKNLSLDQERRKYLSQNATALIKNHSVEVVRDEFKKTLASII